MAATRWMIAAGCFCNWYRIRLIGWLIRPFLFVFLALWLLGDGMLLLGLAGSGMNVRIYTTNRLDLANCRGFLQVRGLSSKCEE